MVTIRDIAKEAGVSVSTVSFAFNDSGPVAPETKEKIFEVIRRLNYQPNSAARGLAMQKTNTVCLYTPHPGSAFFNFSGNSTFSDLLQGVGEIIDQKSYNLLLSWDNAREDLPRALRLARQQSVDGFLFMLPSHETDMLEELTALAVPFVVMGRKEDISAVNTVDVDNFDAAYRNTKHLIDLGHSRIGFVSPGPEEYLVCSDRLEGYQSALTDNDCVQDPALVFIGNDRQESGYEAATAFCSLTTPPTAIVAGRDVQAIGVLQYAREHGLRVPQDVAIVSFEDSALAKEYGLTSIRTNLYDIGRESARLLFQIVSRKKQRAPQNVILPSELVIRTSCGATDSTDATARSR